MAAGVDWRPLVGSGTFRSWQQGMGLASASVCHAGRT